MTSSELGDPLPEQEAGFESLVPDLDAADHDPSQAKSQVHQAEFYVGPLPAPRAFREYNEILPGAADRIIRITERQIDLDASKLALAQRQEDHIHKETMAQKQISTRSQWMGFCLVLAILALSYLFIASEATASKVAGTATLITALAGMVGPFLWSTAQNLRHRSDTDRASWSTTISDPPAPPQDSRPQIESKRALKPDAL